MTTDNSFPWEEALLADPSDPSPKGDPAAEPADPPTDLEPVDVVLDVREAGAMLDKLRGDVGAFGRMRDTLLDVVRRRYDTRRQTRAAFVGGGNLTATDLRREAVDTTADADTLRQIGGVFTDAAKEAEGIVADLLDELPPRAGKPRQSATFPDSSGFEIKVARSTRTETKSETDEIVDVVVAHLVARHGPAAAASYGEAARRGIARLLSLLASPKFKVTALDAFVAELEAADDDVLAKRLRAAYGRVEIGEPTVKITRTPTKEGDTE